jgi:methyl halide transferase
MDWEKRYRIGDTPWEKGAAAPPLLEWLGSRGAMQGDVLVPGCGFGHDVRAIAAASPIALVVGLDVAASALDGARQFALAGRETYELAETVFNGFLSTPAFARSNRSDAASMSMESFVPCSPEARC